MSNSHYTDYTGEGAPYEAPPPTYEEATQGDRPSQSSRAEEITFGPIHIWQPPSQGYIDAAGRTAVRMPREQPQATSSSGSSQVVAPRITTQGPKYMYVPPAQTANLQFLPDAERPGGRSVVVVNGATITPGVDFTKVIFHPGGAVSYPMQ